MAQKEKVHYLNDPHLTVETRNLLKLFYSGGSPLETLTKEDARKVLIDFQAAFDTDVSGIEESEKTIESEGYKVVLNIIRPKGAKGNLPVFIYTHGGGWILGDPACIVFCFRIHDVLHLFNDHSSIDKELCSGDEGRGF